MGRQRLITEVLELLLKRYPGTSADKAMALVEWSVQPLKKGKP